MCGLLLFFKPRNILLKATYDRFQVFKLLTRSFLFLNVSKQLSVSFEANVRPSARNHATTDERILIKFDI
jgi:hypothetical protein